MREQVDGETKPNLPDLFKNDILTKQAKNDILIDNEIRINTIKDYYGETKAEELKNRLSVAHTDVQKVWNKYEDKVKFDNLNYKRTAYFSPATKGISINLQQDSIGSKVWTDSGMVEAKKPYQTTCHEIGLLIDYQAGEDSGNKYRYYS